MPHTEHGNTLQEWLDIHGIAISMLPFWTEIIRTSVNHLDFQKFEDEFDTTNAHSLLSAMSGQIVWQLAADALIYLWPEQKPLIATIAKSTVLHFNTEVEQPYTLDNGADAPPEVCINYQARFEDVLAVAHEFGHALQIVANQSRFTPPILREVAAFISELALLHHIKQTPTGIISTPTISLATR